MSKRSSILSLVLLGLLSSSALAMNGAEPDSRKASAAGASAAAQRVGDAVGLPQFPASSAKTRQQVEQELTDWRRNPVAGGYRDVGGELGWKRVPHSYVLQSGQLIHRDSLPHDAPRPFAASSQDKQQARTMYGSGS